MKQQDGQGSQDQRVFIPTVQDTINFHEKPLVVVRLPNDNYFGQPYELTRQWVIWHLIEHDIHHGGELSFVLGAHGLEAPDL